MYHVPNPWPCPFPEWEIILTNLKCSKMLKNVMTISILSSDAPVDSVIGSLIIDIKGSMNLLNKLRMWLWLIEIS